jgi:hypothetical protein
MDYNKYLSFIKDPVVKGVVFGASAAAYYNYVADSLIGSIGCASTSMFLIEGLYEYTKKKNSIIKRTGDFLRGSANTVVSKVTNDDIFTETQLKCIEPSLKIFISSSSLSLAVLPLLFEEKAHYAIFFISSNLYLMKKVVDTLNEDEIDTYCAFGRWIEKKINKTSKEIEKKLNETKK